MTAVDRRKPDTRHPAVGLLIDAGYRVGNPLSIRRNLRIAGRFDREVVFGGDAAAIAGLTERPADHAEKYQYASHIHPVDYGSFASGGSKTGYIVPQSPTILVRYGVS